MQFGKKMDEMEEACSSTVQAHDVDSARQMIAQHQDLKKRLSVSLSLSLSLSVSVFPPLRLINIVRQRLRGVLP